MRQIRIGGRSASKSGSHDGGRANGLDSRLCQWAFVAGALCASGCITTPDWSQDFSFSRLAASPPSGVNSGAESTPSSTNAASEPPLQPGDVRYARELAIPRAPEIWIHSPEPAVASLARQVNSEMTRRLEVGDLSATERRTALLERARARETLWLLPDALVDLDTALRLHPGDVEVELERAWLLGALSRTSESVALMSELFRREQNSQESARVLGLIRFQEGRLDAAAAALGFYVEDAPASADVRLLQAIAEARATGKPVKRWVLDGLATGPDVRWPGPIAGYLLGRLDAAGLLGAAALAPVFSPAAAVCQAWFFVGQNELMHGNREAAAKALLAALHTRATSAVEYRLATAELIHLGVLATNSLPGTPAW